MTIEEKVGQIVFIDITGGYVTDADPALKKWIRLVRHFGVGGGSAAMRSETRNPPRGFGLNRSHQGGLLRLLEWMQLQHTHQ